MRATFPRDEANQGDDEKEPKWMQDFCKDNARQYVINRCEALMQSGRYRDTEAIQMEFYF